MFDSEYREDQIRAWQRKVGAQKQKYSFGESYVRSVVRAWKVFEKFTVLRALIRFEPKTQWLEILGSVRANWARKERKHLEK